MARARKAGQDFLKPSTIQISGYVLIGVFVLMWIFTGVQSSALIGVAASFVLLGRVGAAGDELAKKLGYTRKDEDDEA